MHRIIATSSSEKHLPPGFSESIDGLYCSFGQSVIISEQSSIHIKDNCFDCRWIYPNIKVILIHIILYLVSHGYSAFAFLHYLFCFCTTKPCTAYFSHQKSCIQFPDSSRCLDLHS